MKIALIITGFPRHYDKTYSSIFSTILSKYDTDVYISSWDKQEIDYDPHLDFDNIDKNQQIIDIDIDQICSLYKNYLKEFKFHNYIEYYSNRFKDIKLLDRPDDVFKVDDHAKELGIFWIERLRDQWYIVKQGWDLIKDKSQYDIFIRTRFDIFLYALDLNKFSGYLTISYPEFKHNAIKLSDYIAYGKENQMEIYCTMFDHIQTIYEKHNLNIACSEKLLDFYLKEYSNLDYIFDPFLFYKRIKRKTEGKII